MTTFTDAELDALMDEAIRAKIEHDEWVVQEGITVTNDGLLPRMTAAITYLRAALAAKVRVKPLVWVGSDDPEEWVSDECDIFYEFGMYQLYCGSIVHGEPHKTADLAKAAAQADYNARIIAALDIEAISTQVAPVLTDEMVEAALDYIWGDRGNIRAALTAALAQMKETK